MLYFCLGYSVITYKQELMSRKKYRCLAKKHIDSQRYFLYYVIDNFILRGEKERTANE